MRRQGRFIIQVNKSNKGGLKKYKAYMTLLVVKILHDIYGYLLASILFYSNYF